MHMTSRKDTAKRVIYCTNAIYYRLLVRVTRGEQCLYRARTVKAPVCTSPWHHGW